jgi:hypothetical protein
VSAWVECTEADVLALRKRAHRHTKPRQELLDLANRVARALGLQETDEDVTYPPRFG